MNPLAKQLAALKVALQEFECAVQEPKEEDASSERVLRSFPAAICCLQQLLSDAFLVADGRPRDPRDIIGQAYHCGWLKGELAEWERLVELSFYLAKAPDSGKSDDLAQAIRPSGVLLWETYDLLVQRLRRQAHVIKCQKPVVFTQGSRPSVAVFNSQHG